MQIFIFFVIVLDIASILKVYKDERYLFDNEKLKLYLIIVELPIIGAIYALKRVGFNWITIFTPLIALNRTKVRRISHIYNEDFCSSEADDMEF